MFLFTLSCDKENNDVPQGDVESVDKWISEIVEYRPAPGQFINTSLGNPEGAQSIIGRLGNEVSLGGYGGYIIFKFNHKVKNIEGTDFVIFGNAFKGSSEPGIVMVQSGGVWYELKGSEYDTSDKNYTITYTKPTSDDDDVSWTDNKGGSGLIEKLSVHPQPYFPTFLNTSTLTFTGSKVSLNNHLVGFEWVLDALESGYADNFSKDYDEIVGGDKDTKGSNKFDIANAVDNEGKSVTLTDIDAIKVYNGVNTQSGPLGECSTEIRGAISLTVK